MCRVPIINGVNKDDGALVWFDRSTLENIFNSGGNKSFSPTAFGTDLGAVTSTERLLTSFYLGRCETFIFYLSRWVKPFGKTFG